MLLKFETIDSKSTLTMAYEKNLHMHTLQEFTYCSKCGKAILNYETDIEQCDSTHAGDSAVDFPGIDILKDFITEDEELFLCSQMNSVEWKLSQSGRLKQDYGPKVNFKKRKVNAKEFAGLPSYSRFVVERFALHDCIQGFVPVELCNLEYQPERGSAIDPHFDDWWLWGERLVTLNLLSDVVMTFSQDSQPELVVRVHIPRRAIIVVSGPARHIWKHSIRRCDVDARRIAMTFRELSLDFCAGGDNEHVGSNLVEIANSYAG